MPSLCPSHPGRQFRLPVQDIHGIEPTAQLLVIHGQKSAVSGERKTLTQDNPRAKLEEFLGTYLTYVELRS